MQKTVAVIGPASDIGRVVCAALGSETQFQVRPISRSGTCGGVRADLDNLDELTKALRGADSLFLHLPVDFKDPSAKQRAIQRGHNIAAACRASGVRHIIYATAISPFPMLGIVARHLDARAEVENILRNSPGLDVTCMLVPIPYQALTGGGRLCAEHVEKNMYRFSIPVGSTPIDFVDMADVGAIVKQILNFPTYFLGKTIALSGGKLTVQNICDIFHKYFPSMVFHDRVMTLQEWRSLDYPGAVDQGNAFEFLVRVDQKYSQKRTQELVPDSKTLDNWVAENRDVIQNSFTNQTN